MNNKCDDMLGIIFGKKDKYNKEYENLYKKYNSIAKDGFDVVSSQFSFHYYFKDEKTLRGYLQNLKEVTKKGGYFMGTCYDGMKLFKSFILRDNKNIQGRDDKDVLIYDIVKKYKINNFDYDKEDITNMLGQEITVYMSSIGQYITEYLVNFEFVIDIMKEYDFIPYYPDKASNMNKAIGNFEEIIDNVDGLLSEREKDIQRAYVYAKNIKKDEKYRTLSGLNNWFVFKKV